MSRLSTKPFRRSSICPSQEIISREEILLWVNKRLQSAYRELEELATGAPYCQLMDQLYPGMLNMARVRMDAHLYGFEKALNYGLLAEAFKKAAVPIEMSVERLIAGRFRDHFELCRWLKKISDERELDSAGQAAPQVRDDQGPSKVFPGTTTPWTQREGEDINPGPELGSEKEELEERFKTLILKRDKIRSALGSVSKTCRLLKTQNIIDTTAIKKILSSIRQSGLEALASQEGAPRAPCTYQEDVARAQYN